MLLVFMLLVMFVVVLIMFLMMFMVMVVETVWVLLYDLLHLVFQYMVVVSMNTFLFTPSGKTAFQSSFCILSPHIFSARSKMGRSFCDCWVFQGHWEFLTLLLPLLISFVFGASAVAIAVSRFYAVDQISLFRDCWHCICSILRDILGSENSFSYVPSCIFPFTVIEK